MLRVLIYFGQAAGFDRQALLILKIYSAGITGIPSPGQIPSVAFPA